MSSKAPHKQRTLILGIGNRLRSDDGAGVHVIEALARALDGEPCLRLVDGGTLSFTLLPEIEDAAAFIAVDAGRFGAAPGSVRVFEGRAMDAQLRGNKDTAHEVALSDLISAAMLSGHCPVRRALVAIEPADTGWGMDPTPEVARGVVAAEGAVRDLLARWQE